MKWKRDRESILIKKYGNRRLYDTSQSSYVTLPDIAEAIRNGATVRVVDAKSNQDLTQETLMQIILDGRGAAQLLPVDLLTQLVRMEDAALAEFLGRYMSFALELYFQVKQGAQAIAPWNPFVNLPFSAASNLARFFGNAAPAEPFAAAAAEPVATPAAPDPQTDPPAEASPIADAAPQPGSPEVEALRRELDELKATLGELARAARK
jgi:polyhydroxyalkanoate synthesis repressor PhaR